jgi:hypothetical protein
MGWLVDLGRHRSIFYVATVCYPATNPGAHSAVTQFARVHGRVDRNVERTVIGGAPKDNEVFLEVLMSTDSSIVNISAIFNFNLTVFSIYICPLSRLDCRIETFFACQTCKSACLYSSA